MARGFVRKAVWEEAARAMEFEDFVMQHFGAMASFRVVRLNEAEAESLRPSRTDGDRSETRSHRV